MAELGKTLIIIGAVSIVIGALLLSGKLLWLGRLPGDFAIKNENFSVYFPVATCIIISAAISFIFWLLRK